MNKDALNGSGPVVEVYDTTLRDGTQMEGLSLSCDDKLRIAEHLDGLGMAFVEGGWPGSNPKDAEFFERAKELPWKIVALAAFGSTCRARLRAEDDKQLRTLLEACTPVCTIFGKSWNMHVTEILRTTLEENLRMIEESVTFLRGAGRRVIYDAEHFFDGYKSNPEYALQTLSAAEGAGSETLVLCDTNGGSMPWEVEAIVQVVKERFPEARLGIHAHNDGECGVANSLAAVRAGARHVQGTINGYGERCGNANLCSIIPDVELKMGLRCLPEGGLKQLYELAHFVAEIANLNPDDHAAYVGRSAFAHKGGVHVSAIRRHPESYEHVRPALVGNASRVVVSELSGRSNVLSKAEELGLQVSSDHGSRILEKIKELEAKGFAYEAAEASVALLMARQQSDYKPPFEVLDFQAGVGSNRQSADWRTGGSYCGRGKRPRQRAGLGPSQSPFSVVSGGSGHSSERLQGSHSGRPQWYGGHHASAHRQPIGS
jgi:2-isopropylmalate synthase